jgi:uncharacterized membrane protein YhfC
MAPPGRDVLDGEDQALLERVAARVVELHLEVPAILALETGRPLSVLAAQTLHFFEPLVAGLLRLPDYQRFARLVERRETIEVLLRAIEGCAEAAQRARRETVAARRAAGPRRGRPS